MSEMRLFDPAGNRLYLNTEERAAFLAEARKRPSEVRTFAETLHFTGCRISEALALSPKHIDLSGGQIIINSLKKRRTDVYRTVPAPPEYLDTLNTAHGIREASKSRKKAAIPLWQWSRQHAWAIVKDLMIEAGVPDGPHQTPKGLRHGYGVNAISKGTPLNLLQKWLGHADIATTAIYANAMGAEEQDIAARMWE